MTPQEFIHKWKRANLSERSAYQQHFLDLCELLNQPKPAAEDPDGAFYTFERGVHKTDRSHGWADVWFRGHFGWEYKKKRKDRDDAYTQLELEAIVMQLGHGFVVATHAAAAVLPTFNLSL